MPDERAVPTTWEIADSRREQFRSLIFVCAMSVTCAIVTRPTLFRFGWPDPFSSFAALNSSVATGGVLVMKVNERST